MTFQNLTVWQKSHRLVLDIYRATTEFPKQEMYGLVNQMRRASVSVPANIAEGYKRRSRREFANFISIAEGSLEELKYYVKLSQDLNYLSPHESAVLYQVSEEVGRMLNGLKQYVKRRLSHETASLA